MHDQVQFDHIKAFSLGGASDTANIAPMCATHNKEKGQLSLFDFRTKLRLKEFFSQGDKLTLKDLLEYFKVKKEIKEYGQLVTSFESDGTINVSSAHSSFKTTLQTCPATGWKYFYYILDVELLNSDDDEDGAIDRSLSSPMTRHSGSRTTSPRLSASQCSFTSMRTTSTTFRPARVSTGLSQHFGYSRCS